MKPKYLYHGSPYLNDVLKPQQAESLKINSITRQPLEGVVFQISRPACYIATTEKRRLTWPAFSASSITAMA